MTHYIHGAWMEGTGEAFQSLNPATQETIWKGNAASKEEIDKAVAGAQSALPGWSALALEEREKFVEDFKEKLIQYQDEMADIISHEVGKPHWESQTEVGAMIAKVDISIRAHRERCPQKSQDAGGKKLVVEHKPHGVAAIFAPFNFPGHLPNGHMLPALLAGNTIILKPSELTPQVGQKIIQIWESCALPDGVINLLQGGKETGIHLSGHPDLNALFFTGSSETGKILSEQYGKHPEKILALELGGNNPLVIGEISDLTAAAYLILQSAYLTSGQRCTCARRLIIPEGARGNELLELLETIIPKIRIGAWNEEPPPFMGPLISEDAADRVMQAQKELEKLGGNLLVPTKRLEKGPAFLSPGLIDVTKINNKPDKEIFGPFLQVIRVLDLKHAIAEANATKYGLCAGLLSDSKEEWELFFQNIRAGVVNWNTQLTGASSAAPFGGIGESGNHRPSAYYAADYCAYPVASMQNETITMPSKITPGIVIE